jgi:hypothetical protein
MTVHYTAYRRESVRLLYFGARKHGERATMGENVRHTGMHDRSQGGAMPEVLTDAAQATPDWLNRVLRGSGHLPNGEVTGVRELGRETQPHSTAVRLEVWYRGYVRLPTRLFLKLAREADPAWAGHEVDFYRRIVPPMQLAMRSDEFPFVRCFDAEFDPTTGCSHVLLEDLSLTHGAADAMLPPIDAHCEGMIDALAALHGFWWESPALGREIGVRPSAAGIGEMLAAAQGNLAAWLDMMGDRVSPGRRAVFERICAAWPPRRMAREIAGHGLTLVNRDTHAGNFLYPKDPASGRVRLVDWQSWRVDTGTDDLAYMMAAHWYSERRTRLEKLLVARYHRRLVEGGISDYSWDNCWENYKASVIRVLFFLIGGWQPGRAPALWFDRVEKATIAYQELGCAQLLP